MKASALHGLKNRARSTRTFFTHFTVRQNAIYSDKYPLMHFRYPRSITIKSDYAAVAILVSVCTRVGLCTLFIWFFNSPMLPPTSILHLGHLHLTAETPMRKSRYYRLYGLPLFSFSQAIYRTIGILSGICCCNMLHYRI